MRGQVSRPCRGFSTDRLQPETVSIQTEREVEQQSRPHGGAVGIEMGGALRISACIEEPAVTEKSLALMDAKAAAVQPP